MINVENRDIAKGKAESEIKGKNKIALMMKQLFGHKSIDCR